MQTDGWVLNTYVTEYVNMSSLSVFIWPAFCSFGLLPKQEEELMLDSHEMLSFLPLSPQAQLSAVSHSTNIYEEQDLIVESNIRLTTTPTI